MNFDQFHFEDNRWFWGLIAIPVLCILYGIFYKNFSHRNNFSNFADEHLLDHIVKKSSMDQISLPKSLFLGSILWSCLICAMAGPRWDFKEVMSYKEEKNLVIALDLSASMSISDIKPSRIVRAKQEIEDIIKASKNVKIGLVAFAADAHIIVPITQDVKNILHLLPSVDTDLVSVQGSRVIDAIEVAKEMLSGENGSNKNILIISDGGFSDSGGLEKAKNIAKNNGIVIHTLGVASEEGAPVVNYLGQVMRSSGKPIILKLEKDNLQKLSYGSGGKYFETDFVQNNTNQILKLIEKQNADEENYKKVLYWEERFYIFLIPVMLVVVLWFRRGFTIPFILFLMLSSSSQTLAISITDKLFLNNQQIAKKYLEEGDAEPAIDLFEDPYKKGVAYYKKGDFKNAEESFRENKRPEVQESAWYNLSNSLAKQNKFEEALETYEKVLEINPNNQKAKNNKKLVEEIIESLPKNQQSEGKNGNKEEKSQKDGESGKGGGGGNNSSADSKENGKKDSKSNNGNGGAGAGESNSDKNRKSDKDNSSDKDGDKDNSKGKKEHGEEDGEGNKNKTADDKQNDNDKNDDEKVGKSDKEEKEDNDLSQEDSNREKNQDNEEKEKQKKEDLENDGKKNNKENNLDQQKNENNQDQNNSGKAGATDDGKKLSEEELEHLLSLISQDYKFFLKNKFYIESRNNKTQPTSEPW